MKTPLIIILISLLLAILLHKATVAQTIYIGGEYTTDTLVQPFIGVNKIYQLQVNGTVKLHSDTSLVRIIMVDQNGNNYLVYEAYPLITVSDTLYVSAGCDETCYLYGLTPNSIRIDIINGSFHLDSIFADTLFIHDAEILQHEKKLLNDSAKMEIMNNELERLKMYWRAGRTCFSDWSFQQKETFFGNKYLLYGFEYYRGGVFEFPHRRISGSTTSSLVPSFNWRSRHNANKTWSPYFDGDQEYKTGWSTIARYQGNCNTCSIFATAAAVEARMNLYYNVHNRLNTNHLDYNISEQDIRNCPTLMMSCADGSLPSQSYLRLKQEYRCSEDAYVYNPNKITCEKPANCSGQVKIQNYVSLPLGTGNEEVLKEKLITHGPITVSVPLFPVGTQYLPHAVALVGFETLSYESVFSINTRKNKIYHLTVDKNSNLNGSTVYCYKNSWGPSWGDNGFGYIGYQELDHYDYATGYIYWQGHDHLPNSPTTSIQCSDEDGDGYYWWGISQTTPCASCPQGIAQQEDCDDSDRNLGPYDATYSCTSNCDFFEQSFTVSTNVITNDVHQKSSIIIPSGVTFTISSTVYMAPGRKITVEKGGQLIVSSSGKITSACNQLWNGIEVRGEGNTQNLTNQGKVVLHNGATIENAICGIKSIKATSFSTGSGAIIQATGANFINNRTAVHLTGYSSPITQSFFYNCSFKTTEILLDNSNPSQLVYLEGLTNADCIEFKGCLFENTGLVRYVKGIKAYNSFFSCSNNGATLNTFMNFKNAIYATGSNTTHMNVENCDFSNNAGAVFVSAGIVPRIKSNSINIALISGPNPDNSGGAGTPVPAEPYEYSAYGIYLDACSGYLVEDNSITSGLYSAGANNAAKPCGLYIRNSGAVANEIYRNSLSYLFCGIAAFGINRNGTNEGLNLKCNTITNCGTDIGVYRGALPLAANLGIRRDQGEFNTTDPAKSAGNVFSSLGFQYHNNDINNATCMPIRYNHHRIQSIPSNVRMIPVPLMSPGVEIYNNDGSAFSSTLSCPSNPGKAGSNGAMLVQKSDSLQIEIDELVATLQQNIDGGNTAETAENILFSAPYETYSVYSDLIEKSPYLSDTVMKNAVVREDLLPDVMLRDILVANPQAAKSDTIYNALESRIAPLNDTLMGDIMANAEVYGEKELLQMQKAEVEQHYGLILNQRILNILSDTTVLQKTDSLIAVHTTSNRLADKYALSLLYSAQGNENSSAMIMDEIANEFYLTNYRQEEYKQYKAWLCIVNRAISNNNSLAYDSVQVNNLQAMLAIDSLNLFLPTVLARNVLVNEGILDYDEPLVFDSELKSADVHKQYPKLASSLNVKAYLHIFPNPAKEYIIARFRLASGCSKGVIRIYQSDGKQIASIPVNCTAKELIIPLNSNSYGPFLFSLYSCELFVDSKKIIVKK